MSATAVQTRTLLDVRDLDAGYGPFRAIFGISFAIEEGHVLALLGANGAGKSTVARVVSGLIAPTAGTIGFDGVDVTGRRAYRLARMGIAHAPEGRSVFSSLTVEENLVLAFRSGLGRAAVASALDEAYGLFPRLGERRRQTAGTLSGGEQRMLALARVLVLSPRLLVVDELSLGLAPIIVDEVYETLATIRERGTTLLIIEQYVGHALAIADDVVLLDKGEVAFSGPKEGLGDLAHQLLTGE